MNENPTDNLVVPQSPFKVLILHNIPVLPLDHPDADSEHEVIETVEIIETALAEHGVRFERFGLAKDLGPLIQRLNSDPPDVVFNMFEGFADFTETEVHLAGLLEWMKIPFTGSKSQALAVGRNKALAKAVLQSYGVSTPGFFWVNNADVPENKLGWPVIVKPATQDASIGVDQGSVVTSQYDLVERVKLLLKNYGPPVLVEQFIDGRELTAAVIEDPEIIVLAPSEIHFTIRNKGLWPIISYDAKWKPDSVEFEGTPYEYPAKLTPELLEKVKDTVKRAYLALGIRDYGRIDMRVSSDDTIYVIEVNPNPDLHIVTGLAISLDSANQTYGVFLENLVTRAWKRGP
jgi:D-alanine-D-alanine ligase